jgi:dihydrofolate reductase
VAPTISIIVAMDRNRLIGSAGRLPWHLPADLRHFKQTTLGKPVAMGRKTWESIGKPLPGRINIVVTSNKNYKAQGCIVVTSLDQAIRSAGDALEIMIIGGADLYRQVWSRTDRIYLTCIDAVFEGDTWFPDFDRSDWAIEDKRDFSADDRNRFAYSFVTLARRRH